MNSVPEVRSPESTIPTSENGRWCREVWLQAIYESCSLDPRELAVAIVFYHQAGRGDWAAPSYRFILERAVLGSQTTVCDKIRDLVRAGWLTVLVEGKGRRSTRYGLRIPAAFSATPSVAHQDETSASPGVAQGPGSATPTVAKPQDEHSTSRSTTKPSATVLGRSATPAVATLKKEELKGGTRMRATPPPPRPEPPTPCPKHPGGNSTDERCHGCGDYRLALTAHLRRLAAWDALVARDRRYRCRTHPEQRAHNCPNCAAEAKAPRADEPALTSPTPVGDPRAAARAVAAAAANRRKEGKRAWAATQQPQNVPNYANSRGKLALVDSAFAA